MITLESAVGIILSFMVFLTCFQISTGALPFIHAQETCHEVIVAFGQNLLYLSMIATGFLTPLLLQKLGAKGTFGFYMGIGIISLIHQIFITKDTTYGVDEKGQKVKLSDKQKKELYMPDEFKD